MAEGAPREGGFDRGFGGRGGGDRGRGDRGDRGRGRGRGRPRGRKDEEEKWVPCTKLGRLVQQVQHSSDAACGGKRKINQIPEYQQPWAAGQDQESGADLPVLHACQGIPDSGELPWPLIEGRGDEDHARPEADPGRPEDALQGEA